MVDCLCGVAVRPPVPADWACDVRDCVEEFVCELCRVRVGWPGRRVCLRHWAAFLHADPPQ